jgi:hypothetical protein
MSRLGDLRKHLVPFRGLYRQSAIRNGLLKIIETKRHRIVVENGGKRFILFLVPGQNLVNGGLISIFSIAEETMRQKAIHGATAIVCTPHNEPRITKFTKFENDARVFAFDDLVSLFPLNSTILVHVPELFASDYVAEQTATFLQRPDITWQFNVLLQNIDLIPSSATISTMSRIGKVTATTAHASYGNERTADRLGCPVHHLSTAASPRGFRRVQYGSKEKLIVISPDQSPAKSEIVQKIREALPDHQIQQIRNMTYRKYRETIEKAKFAFTFGEGLDGYFVETIFSGGIGMAIFNDQFFESHYSSLDGVFANSGAAIATVADFIRRADRSDTFGEIASRQFEVVARNYVHEEYVSNLQAYYSKYFSTGAG